MAEILDNFGHVLPESDDVVPKQGDLKSSNIFLTERGVVKVGSICVVHLLCVLRI